ncbi:uncharacterized protein LODBEIA_P22040 [Lodderomyces beijingensis]|uniref:Regulator of phospholipase D SRF1 n=1 Tax=Lodderomyces beijingensis TaxID=1775926 RepID=A0ABP0ZP37_9ASCO
MPGVRQEPSHLAAIPENPFQNYPVKSYSHKPNVIPSYVLDSISKYETHQKATLSPEELQQQQQLQDVYRYSGITDDPYIRSIGGSWYQFKESISTPMTYPKYKISRGTDHLDKYDWNSPWGGEERLRKEFGYSSDSDATKVPGLFSFFRSKDPDDDKPKTSATYWMQSSSRTQLKQRIKKIFMFDPLVPLILRIFTLIFCAVALALACSIFVFSNHEYNGRPVQQQASTIMAIVVQTCALVYVMYIAWDEYTGKPLGLREPMSKLGLVLLDLLFIIFSSANLSLAFNTMFDDEWVCEIYRNPDILNSLKLFPVISSICVRQRALASFLFVVLVTWVLTFTISLLRVIDRVNAPK